MAADCDYLIVGAGLAGGLIALALRHHQPQAKIVIIERNSQSAGNHTWAFHTQDLPAAAEDFVRPLVVAHWPSYTVSFPGSSREVPCSYSVITAERFASVLQASGCELRTQQDAVRLNAKHVELRDGSILQAHCVIDARGPTADAHLRCGYQKFLGLEVETTQPWPQVLPTVMDACVPQDDGYRFVYVLPFTPHRVLVEDTYFSDSPQLDHAKLRSRVAAYLCAAGIDTWKVLREESGVLPMPWSGGRVVVDPSGPLQVGYAGGWFHPATGYSFPLSVRLALAVASVPPEQAHTAAAALARRVAPRQRFARFLNRLLFTLVTPSQRWQVFRRLYRSLPDALMARFYALEFGPIQATRLVVGWPPPISPLRLLYRAEALPCL